MQPRLANVLDPGRLDVAFERVWRNQGMAGVDGVALPAFRRRLAWQLECLRDDVLSGRYRPQALRRFAIEKPGKKPRYLMVPAVRDRVLQTAMVIELEPLFESLFDAASWGYRPQRSWNDAVEAVRKQRQRGLNHLLDADIRGCFDNIPHFPLLDAFSRVVRDAALQALLLDWIRGEVREDGVGDWCPCVGIGQGSPLSPLLCNLYLTPLDQACRRAGFALVRYADDFIIACESEVAALDARKLVEIELAALGLQLSPEKTRITSFDAGFRFLGWDFLGDRCLPRPDMKRPPPSHGDEKIESAHSAQWLPQSSTVAAGGDNLPQTAAESSTRLMTRPGVDDTSPPEPTAGLPALADDPSEAGRDDGSPRLITLYLLEQHTLAGITGDRFVISRHGETLREILIRQVDQIVVFGNITLTTPFLDRCLTEGIPVYLLSAHGRYFGLVDNFDNASLLLLREQLARAADPTFSLLVAKELLRGKIHNGRTLLRRLSRRRASPELEEGILATGKILERIPGAPNGATLLGYEGTAARTLFAAYGAMVDPAWGFRGRNRQPPKDPINAMLSLGYTMLFQNTLSLIRIAGLHPHAGFLHAMTPGHPALASDLMEEHRAGVVDALVLDIALNGPLSPADFVLPRDAGDACLLTPDARKLFLRLLEARLLTRMEHPDHGRPVERRRIIESQARRLVAAIRANDPKLFKAWLQR